MRYVAKRSASLMPEMCPFIFCNANTYPDPTCDHRRLWKPLLCHHHHHRSQGSNIFGMSNGLFLFLQPPKWPQRCIITASLPHDEVFAKEKSRSHFQLWALRSNGAFNPSSYIFPWSSLCGKNTIIPYFQPLKIMSCHFI